MKHPSTRAVYAYWTAKRGTRSAPDRGDIDPADIRHALGDTIMLAADFVDTLRLRLAGTRVCALFGREIKGEALAELFGEMSQPEIERMLDAAVQRHEPVITELVGRTADNDTVDLELMLLPLAHTGLARIRAIGVLAPLVPPYWLGERPLVSLDFAAVQTPAAEDHAAPSLAPAPSLEDVRVRHGFVVYSGGRNGHSGKEPE